MFKVIDAGTRERRNYARIDEVLDLPNLIEIQKHLIVVSGRRTAGDV